MAISVISGILGVIFAICLCCGFSSLKTAIDVIDASADFLAKTKRIVFVPILYFFVSMIVVALWLGATLSVFAMADIEAERNSLIPQDKDFMYNKDPALKKKITILSLILFFGMIWIFNFIKAKTSFIVMVSASFYYFDSDAEKEGSADISTAFNWAYMYHAGSLAYGSLLISIIQFVKYVLVKPAEAAAKQGGDNAAVKTIVACALCLIKCLEETVDYINKTAYAFMAVSGESFCTSAMNGFILNIKHGMKFYWANLLAQMFILLGKIAIVFLNCFSLYMIMKHVTKDTEEVSSLFMPMFVVAIETYMAASIFLGVLDETVLALLNCLCVDMDLNGEIKYGPPTFHDSLSKLDSNEKDEYTKPNTIQ
jgi:hypothetical protein